MKSWKMTPISRVQIVQFVLAQVHAIQQNPAFVGSYSRVISLTMVVFPCPFSPISATRSPGCRVKFNRFRIQPLAPGIVEATFRNSNPLRMDRGAGSACGLRPDRRLHLEKRQQVGKEQRLVGDAREGWRRSAGCCCWPAEWRLPGTSACRCSAIPATVLQITNA